MGALGDQLVQSFNDNGVENVVLLIALAHIRVVSAFSIIPIFGRQSIPALLFYPLFVGLGFISIVVQPAVDLAAIESSIWLQLFVKEALIGIVLGFFFAVFLWAFEAAGIVIDAQISGSIRDQSIPLGTNQSGVSGTFIRQWAIVLFAAAGGLMLIAGAIVESFKLWPLAEPINSFQLATVRLIEAEFQQFFSLTVRIAGPIIIVLFLIDVSLGVLSRFTQYTNHFVLSLSLKSIATILMMIILLPILVDTMISELGGASGSWQRIMQSLFGV